MPNLTSVGLTAGAATSGTGTVSTLDNIIGTAGTGSAQVLTVQGSASGTAQPVSAASLPLPTGAATAAKQPALGTAGSASTDVITVQGIASGTAQSVSAADAALVTIGAKTDAKSTATDTTSVSGISVWKQISASVQSLVTNATALGRAAMTASVPVIHAGYEYETVAASQTAQALGATGATGDMIFGVLVIPATTSPGNVLLLDNATSITIFTGGASSITNLVPFFVPLNLTSVSGAWKLTTGANVSCIGIGDFT